MSPLSEEGVEAFSVSPVGNLIAVVADRGATSELQLVDANTRTPRRVPGIPPGIIWNVSWHGSGTALAIEFAGARTFRDVYVVDVKSGRVERWTTSEMGGVSQDSLPDAEIIHWKSFDGRMIPGILYRPAKRFTGPRPVMINVHGGPETRERPRALCGGGGHVRRAWQTQAASEHLRRSPGASRLRCSVHPVCR